MSTLETPMKSWIAPGPGLWERDAAHQERPFSCLWLDACLAASAEGMAERGPGGAWRTNGMGGCGRST